MQPVNITAYDIIVDKYMSYCRSHRNGEKYLKFQIRVKVFIESSNK